MIRRNPLAWFFVLAYGLSWTLWAPLWLPPLGVRGLPVLPYHHALGALGPVTAAFLVAAFAGGGAEVAALVRRLGAWRGRGPWIAVALLGPVLVVGLAVAAVRVGGDTSASFDGFGVSREFPALSLPGFLAYNLLTFGYGEEIGWRGLALPRLQRGRTALGATVLLTLGWAGWHAPLFLYRPGYVSMGLGGTLGWFASLLTGAVLLTWLFNESGGSILVVALFHASVDVVFTSDLASPPVVTAAGALITLWGLAVLAWAGPRFLSRRGRMVQDGARLAVDPRPGGPYSEEAP